jgi:hypothetical protein
MGGWKAASCSDGGAADDYDSRLKTVGAGDPDSVALSALPAFLHRYLGLASGNCRTMLNSFQRFAPPIANRY